ncbi:MAG: hypothetical protein QM820_18445 [Minicystis sp.]
MLTTRFGSIIPFRARAPLAAIALAITGLAACGGGGNENTGGGSSTSSSSTGGSGGAAPGCPAGSHPGTSAACEATLTGWSDGPKLDTSRDHHATTVVTTPDGKSAFLLVLAGVQNSANLLKSIERASINADGSLGAFEVEGDLPEAMAGHSIAVVGSTVIIAGGLRITGNKLVPSAKTEFAKVQADGSLSAWTEGPTMSTGRFHGAMIAYKSFVYAVGGLDGDGKDNTPSVDRATVAADGTLGPWTAVTALPGKRSHHGLAIDGNHLYVTGGLSGDPAGVATTYDDVLQAQVNEDGSLGDWTAAGTLAVTVETHSSFVHVGQLYVVGGVEKNAYDTKHVKRAPLLPDGTIGAWENLADLPKARAHVHHTPVYGGFIYSPGGAVNHASLDDVVIGKLE